MKFTSITEQVFLQFDDMTGPCHTGPHDKCIYASEIDLIMPYSKIDEPWVAGGSYAVLSPDK